MLHRLQTILFITLTLLPTLTVSFRARRKPESSTHPHIESLAAHPVRRHKSAYSLDCWQKRPVTRHAVLSELGEEINRTEWGPGAGMDPSAITPFQTVIKDGWFEIGCGKDYLYNHGDKFGDNKLSYSITHIENISIVRYSRHVSSAEAQPMTHEVCFNFCRTIPEMLTFGIINGYECYCAPFYKPMESDGSICDVVCEGNPTQMCGGAGKSSVFEMHSCADTTADLTTSGTKASDILPRLAEGIAKVTDLRDKMQAASAALQARLSRKGDIGGAAVMQAAKATAGELSQELILAQKVYDDLSASTDQAAGLTGSELTGMQLLDAEKLSKTMMQLVKSAEDHLGHLNQEIHDVHPGGPEYNESVNASKQYVSIMHYIDNKYEKVPQTCAGIVTGHPKVDINFDECAHACDHLVNECLGFSWYRKGVVHMCFLFSKFTSVRYYTTCATKRVGFKPTPSCMVKAHKFDGTKIKPDPTGQCTTCLEAAVDTKDCVLA